MSDIDYKKISEDYKNRMMILVAGNIAYKVIDYLDEKLFDEQFKVFLSDIKSLTTNGVSKAIKLPSEVNDALETLRAWHDETQEPYTYFYGGIRRKLDNPHEYGHNYTLNKPELIYDILREFLLIDFNLPNSYKYWDHFECEVEKGNEQNRQKETYKNEYERRDYEKIYRTLGKSWKNLPVGKYINKIEKQIFEEKYRLQNMFYSITDNCKVEHKKHKKAFKRIVKESIGEFIQHDFTPSASTDGWLETPSAQKLAYKISFDVFELLVEDMKSEKNKSDYFYPINEGRVGEYISDYAEEMGLEDD